MCKCTGCRVWRRIVSDRDRLTPGAAFIPIVVAEQACDAEHHRLLREEGARRMAGRWRCLQCGDYFEAEAMGADSRFRWAGDRWQHAHAWPVGHCDMDRAEPDYRAAVDAWLRWCAMQDRIARKVATSVEVGDALWDALGDLAEEAIARLEACRPAGLVVDFEVVKRERG